jgi:starch-binding outer membrane protein, SusD/RagB family
MTYADLMDERRVEFGLESQSWLDVKRRFYRNSSEALEYLNTQGRAAAYRRILEATTQENDPNGYELVFSDKDNTNPGTFPPNTYVGTGSRTDNTNNLSINSFTDGVMTLPIPVTEVVANPKLADEPVPYEFN